MNRASLPGRLVLALALAVGISAGVTPVATATTAPIAVFKLLGNYVNSKGGAIALDPLGSPSFITSTVPGVGVREVFIFAPGDGLHVTGIPTGARSTYTVEAWFYINEVGPSYKRIMSFGPNDEDAGLYFYDGTLYLYDHKETPGAVTSPYQWVKVRVTRSHATKVMKVYFNGAFKFKYTDSGNEYLLNNGEIVFFQDDGSEHPSGLAARIKIWDRVVAP